MAAKKPTAFVIMPFSKAVSKKNKYQELGSDELDTVFSLIKEVLNRRFKVKRAESPTDILRDIILDLDRADLVIADLTSLNPNVMYELGIRHGFCKKTILVTQDRTELPFDIAGYQCIEYQWITEANKKKFKEDLNNILTLLEEHEDPRYGPVHTHLGIKAYGYKEIEYENSIKRLRGLFKELGWLITSIHMAVGGLENRYPEVFTVNDNGTTSIDAEKLTPDITKEIEKVASIPQTMPCVDLVIAENYIPEEYNAHQEIDHFIQVLLTLRNSNMYASYMDGGFFEGVNRVLMQAMVHTVQIVNALEKRLAGDEIFEIDPDFSSVDMSAGIAEALTKASSGRAKGARR